MKKIVCIASLTLLTLAPEGSGSGMAIRSPSVIASCAGRHEASLAYAYESSFKTQSNWPEVKAVVGFDITAPGDVKDFEILAAEGFDALPEGPALSAMFEDKITGAAYTWRFPAVHAGVVTVEMPFSFVPVEKEAEETTDEETPSYRESSDYGKIVEREEEKIYVFKERVIECRREQAIPFEKRRATPEGEVFARAAKAETKKPARGYLKDVGKYFEETHNPTTAGLNKKLASRERGRRDAEAALAEEELRAAAADLGLAEGYEWDLKGPNEKKAKKLREKRDRLSEEIERLTIELVAAEETRALSLAEDRAELIARGEELLGEAPPGGDPWLSFALAELHLDAGEGTNAVPLFEEISAKAIPAAEAEALYGLAQAYVNAGDEEKAAQTFLRLTTEYPDFPRRGEAYFRLGEYSTSQLEPEKAEEYFLHASQSDGEYGDAALYRAAWSYYECSNPFGTTYYDRAVRAFKRFLDAAQKGSEYWDHAIEMTGFCLAEWEPGTVERPAPLGAQIRYEEVFGGAAKRPYAADVLRALGDAYLYKMDKLPEAAVAYEKLLEKYPSYDDAAAVITSIVDSHRRREGYDDAHAARLRAVDEYGPDSSWYRAQAGPTRCRALLNWENTLYEVGVYYNMQAERKYHKNRDEALAFYKNAIDRYKQYLASFPTNEKAYHINFYLAEVYFAVENYETAAQQYIKTATHYTDRERYKIDKWDEKFTQEQSLYNAISSYEELYEVSRPVEGSGKIYAKEVLNTCEEFLTRYAENVRPVDVITVLLIIGDVYFREGDIEKAREYYTRVVVDYPEPIIEDPRWGTEDREVNRLYISALKKVADTYLKEARLTSTGAESIDEKYVLYQYWFEKAEAEAAKRNEDFDYEMESLE